MTSKVRALVNRLFGDRGERTAARFLRRNGLRVLMRGYRTSQGEIDLIAREGNVLVFVEVKARRHGSPKEAVDFQKQRCLTLAALHFQRKYNLLDHPSRFDVVGIVWPDDRKPPQIDHVRNAFEAVGRGQMFR
jgi:putative endonuclease